MLKKFKLRSRSKSREKDAKYIPAAIIPSVAFVVNPTLPTLGSFDSNSNNLLNSTLNSSLVGLSSEFRKHQDNKSDDYGEDYERGQYAERRSNGSGSDIFESSEKESEKKHKSKKKAQKFDSANSSKRHIHIANGLFAKKTSTPKIRHSKDTDNAEIDDANNSSSHGSNYEDTSPKKVQHTKLGLEFLDNAEIDDANNTPFHDFNVRSDYEDTSPKKVQHTKLGFEILEKQTTGTTTREMREDLRFDENSDNEYDKIKDMNESFDKSLGKSFLPVPPQYKDSSTSERYEDEVKYSIPFSSQKGLQKPEGDDRNIKQLKDENRALQNTIYRLNLEISHLLPEKEAGRSIGKSVFPGKGPAPSWIMNTKYLTPLVAAYDLKFQRQNNKIENMRTDIFKFENELRSVLKENEELHSHIHMNGKNGHTNHREWHIIAKQTKLVIEENQLLLRELDIQQHRTQALEKKHNIDIQELKNALPRVVNQTDHEIENKKEVKESTYETNASPSIKKDGFYPEINMLQCKIEDLIKNNGSLETEIEYLRNNDKKMKKKVEKLKSALKAEKEFHKYLSDVIDKSNDITNERDRLAMILEQHDNEISRVNNKMRNQIKYNLDLGIDSDMSKITSGGKIHDVFIEELLTLESWLIMLVQTVEDLNNRCRHQEKDVHYYQSLLKEKDKSLQECEKENEELELKLDLVWKNATKDAT